MATSENTGQFKKGERPSKDTEFKAGQEPWNKGVVYTQILGEKHPQWKGVKPDCADCGIKLKSYTAKRCSPCHLKSDAHALATKKAHQATKGKPGPRLGVKFTEEQKQKMSLSKKGQVAWNAGLTSKDDPRILSGEENPAWRGGKRTENEKQRAKFRQTILPRVLLRDDYTCQICEARGVYLHVDHIKRWSEYPELRFDMDNCRTLCMACHYYVTFKRKIPKGKVWGIVPDRRIA